MVLKWILITTMIGISEMGRAYGDDYQVCFTPGGNCTKMIVSAINGAQNSIDVQAYGFTSKPIINALLKAEQKGIRVRVILDKSNLSGQNSGIPMLQSRNIPISIDYQVKIAHNKAMIIDDKTVITGSFNFTSSAQDRNAENVLIITNLNLASEYEENFQNRLSASASYNQCLLIKKCAHAKYLGKD